MAQINYPFDSSADYIFDSGAIEVTGGKAQLKQSISGSTPFDDDMSTSGDWTFDSSKIEFTGGKAQLKLNNNTGQSFNQPFTSDTGFTYNASKSEFTAGQVQQKDQTPATANFGANFTSSFDANWAKVGSVTATSNGSPTLSGGKAVCTGYVQKGLYYNITHDGVASIKVRYTPNYTGNPPGNVNVFGIQEPTGNNNRIFLSHSPSGDNFRLWISNNVGTAIYTATTIGGSGVGLVSGTSYELELNWDNVTGVVRLFKDGVLHGTLTPGAWAFTANAARLYVGAMPTAYNLADGSFDDLLFFSNVQHTTGYTPGYTVPSTIYAEDLITLPVFTYGGLGNIQAFSSLTSTEGGAPKYILNGLYWNGSAWVSSSDTYATAASKVDSNANIASLPASDTLTVKVVTQGNNTQDSVNDLTAGYTGQIYPTTNPTLELTTAITPANLNAWLSFTETVTEPGTDEVKYILSDDNGSSWKYWNGSSWATSDTTYAQSSTGAQVTTNFSAFPTTGSVKIRAFLHSNDGSTTPDIDNLNLTYNTFSYATTNPTIKSSLARDAVAITNITESKTVTGSDTIQYTIEVDGTEKYWNAGTGTFDTNTLGYAETSTLSNIINNIASLDISAGAAIRVVAYLHSDDGSTTPELLNLELDYTPPAPVATKPGLITSKEEIKAYLGITGTAKDAQIGLWNCTATMLLTELLNVDDLVSHSVIDERVTLYNPEYLVVNEFPVDLTQAFTLKDGLFNTITGYDFALEPNAKRRLMVKNTNGTPTELRYEYVYASYTAGYVVKDKLEILDNTNLTDKTFIVDVAGVKTIWTLKDSGATGNQINIGATATDTAAAIAAAFTDATSTGAVVTFPLSYVISKGTVTDSDVIVTSANIPVLLKAAVALLVGGFMAEATDKRGGVVSYSLGTKNVTFANNSDAIVFKTIMDNYLPQFKRVTGSSI